MSVNVRTDGSEELIKQTLEEFESRTKVVNGLSMPSVFPTEYIESAMRFKPSNEDLVVATYPKSGTNWARYIVSNLLQFDEISEGGSVPIESCPFIERGGIEGLKPGDFYRTHLPFHAERFNPQAKYVFILRNPRDVCVSFYHHITAMMPRTHDKPDGFWFPEYAQLFISGKSWYGDYFEHVLGWLDGPRAVGASEKNVLYLIYEKMKANPREELIRIANFIEGQAAERVKDDKIVDAILSRTSVKAMKEDLNPKMSKLFKSSMTPVEAAHVPDSVNFVRKGQVGDWKNYFTPEISAAFDAWINSDPRNARVMELFEL